MKFIIEKLSVKSSKSTELIRITEEVRKTVQLTGLKNGIVNVFTLHTTTGITINEDDKKLEDDIARFLVKLVPEDDSYAHHRFFRKDGRMAVNAYSHIRASLLGASVTIPLQEGTLVLGSRQNIYLVDLDGPQLRGFAVQILGE